MNKTLLATAVASLLFPIGFAQASESAEQDTLLVTASRFEQSVDSTTAAVSVVTREEIEASQAQDLVQVLNTLPSLQITETGGMGSTQSVFVRGTESDHVLVLIDGVRISSATSGSVSFSAIPLVSVEKIEYLRGAGAAVYGADAIGGVINIITDNKRQGGAVSSTVGSNNYRSLSGLVAGNLTDKLHASIAVSALKTDGFSAKPKAGMEDDDGYASRALSLNANYQLSEQLELGALALVEKSEGEYDGYSSSSADATNSGKLYSVSTHIGYTVDKYQTKLVVSKSQDSSKDFNYSTLYQTDRTQVAWQNQYTLSQDWTLSGGIDWNNDEVESTTSYSETSRDNLAGYLHSQFNNGSYSLEAALRNDENEMYGNHTTWQLGAGYQLTETYRVLANTGAAFRAPTFNDLYYPGYGSEDTKPEESVNYEVGVEAAYDFADIRVSAYRNDIENMITSAYNSTSGSYEVVNYGEVEIKGVEVSGEFETGAISHKVSYDYTNAKNVQTDAQLSRRAKHSAKWNSTYNLDNWQFGISYLYQGKRYDSSTVLDPYSLVDLTGAYSFDNGVKLSSRIGNVFDKEYETANGYNSAERNINATISYQF